MLRHLTCATQAIGLTLLMANHGLAQTAAGDTAGIQACEISAWSIDSDPAGLNVRAGPGEDHPVIGRLPPPELIGGDEYGTEANIVASQDGWFRIDRATTNNYGDGDSVVVFEGDGWVSGRFLRRSIEGLELHVAPAADAQVVFDFADHPGEEKGPDYFEFERMRACQGWWIEVEGTYFGKRVRGWSGDSCGNQVTTCP